MCLLSIVTGTFNEEDNIAEWYRRIRKTFSEKLSDVEYEIIVIDNASTDHTVDLLREIARLDKRVKVIVNTRNFGNLRSGAHALLQAKGDAIISIASDLQDPPEMIPQFVEGWRAGNKLVLAQKVNSEESKAVFLIRSTYYRLAAKLSDIDLLEHVTGFGLYDRRVIEDFRNINDPYPYLRGLICDLGYKPALIPFIQPVRRHGLTKNNWYVLWDLAMLGITNHSKVPLRLAIFFGFLIGMGSFLIAIIYFAYKLAYWNQFEAGMAPMVIGMFFLGAVQLVFIGVLGEYIGSIHTQVLRRPYVIEKERINFE
jgi:glycosyltransferase involved in cell wall biosynthesis